MLVHWQNNAETSARVFRVGKEWLLKMQKQKVKRQFENRR